MARFSLDYYEALFPTKGRGFDELVEALAQELEDYAREVVVGAGAGWTPDEWARSRHSHRPLLLNLHLQTLASLEDRLSTTGAPATATAPRPDEAVVAAFVDEALAVARELRAQLPGHSST